MRVPFTLAIAVLAAVSLAAQGQSQPIFRTGVELITVEASVLDDKGQPVSDLTAADFEIKIAGQVRPVRYARFFHAAASDASAEGATAAAAAPLIPAAATNRAEDGRTVVFVVDRESIQQGAERGMIEAATTILDALGPADASGIFEVPGPVTELTREHGRVKAALRRLTGARPVEINFKEHNITYAEALAFEQRDGRVIAEVVERECVDAKQPDGFKNPCPGDLRIQAQEMLHAGRARVQVVMSNLAQMAERLAPIRGPKQIVFLSSGLPFGIDLLHWYNEFARKAGEAELVLNVVHFDPPEVDVTSRKQNVSSAFGGREMASGLGAVAGTTGGAFYTTGGSGAGIFERIKTEMSNFYELAVEAQPGDAANKSMPIEVKVTRPGLRVRSRNSVAPVVRSTAPLNERVIALLRQATDLAELPIAVSSYTTRGDDPSTLRVVIGAEVGAERFTGPAEWSFAVFNEGNMIATGQQRLDTAGPAPWPAALSAKLLPGQYRLRVAAADASGRAGVIDVPLTVGLRAAGSLQVSDLMLGVAVKGRLQFQSTIPAGASMSGLLEVLGADPAVLERARVVIDIVPAGSAEAVKRFQMAARAGAAATIVTNQVEIPTTGLKPGRYTAAATVLLDDQPIGRVSRVFELR